MMAYLVVLYVQSCGDVKRIEVAEAVIPTIEQRLNKDDDCW